MRRAPLVLAFVLLACSCGAESKTVRVVITSGSHRLVFRAEVAADPGARGKGLMFRKSVAEGTGMLFLFPTPYKVTFYMKNTPVPLDIAWFRSGRLIDIAHMQPCHADPCPTWEPAGDADSALETSVGGLTGAAAGAKVEVFGKVPTAR